MDDYTIGRRQLLASSGAAGAGMMAGCQFGYVGTHQQQGEPAPTIDVDRVAADPTDVPDPIDRNEPREHNISLATEEMTAELKPGATFRYMTFDGQVPGPMIRVRRGDYVNLELTNPEASNLPHNIDFHAVYGPGGGAEDTTIAPGESAEIGFQATYPGIFIYHCAVPNFDHHISAGMYGAILVEPEAGLPEVDRELYFGQNEIYTKTGAESEDSGGSGGSGHLTFDYESMMNEEPSHVVFNGETYAFTEGRYGPVEVEQDEEIRLFFVNGGPNLTSSWHAIGNVWSELYRNGDVVSDPAHFIETTSVPPGTATIATMETPVPGPVKLVDHAATRATKKGALGTISVSGEERPEIYSAGAEDTSDLDYGSDLETYDGWLDDVENFTGVVDRTDVDQPRVMVGTEGNGGYFAFGPAALKVSSGTTVVWEWTGEGGYHNVVDQDGAFQSDNVQEAGYTFEYTFDSTGEYLYSCTPHETLGMKGVIVIE